MQEMKEKELRYLGNGDANSHVCKICFESPTAAMLLPCRHFCCEFSPYITLKIKKTIKKKTRTFSFLAYLFLLILQ